MGKQAKTDSTPKTKTEVIEKELEKVEEVKEQAKTDFDKAKDSLVIVRH